MVVESHPILKQLWKLHRRANWIIAFSRPDGIIPRSVHKVPKSKLCTNRLWVTQNYVLYYQLVFPNVTGFEAYTMEKLENPVSHPNNFNFVRFVQFSTWVGSVLPSNFNSVNISRTSHANSIVLSWKVLYNKAFTGGGFKFAYSHQDTKILDPSEDMERYIIPVRYFVIRKFKESHVKNQQ